MNFFISTKKSTSGWFSRQQSKSAANKKEEKQEESKDSMESSGGEAAPDVAEASSESEDEQFLTTSGRSSDEDERKPVVKKNQGNESGKVRMSEVINRTREAVGKSGIKRTRNPLSRAVNSCSKLTWSRLNLIQSANLRVRVSVDAVDKGKNQNSFLSKKC